MNTVAIMYIRERKNKSNVEACKRILQRTRHSETDQVKKKEEKKSVIIITVRMGNLWQYFSLYKKWNNKYSI